MLTDDVDNIMSFISAWSPLLSLACIARGHERWFEPWSNIAMEGYHVLDNSKYCSWVQKERPYTAELVRARF